MLNSKSIGIQTVGNFLLNRFENTLHSLNYVQLSTMQFDVEKAWIYSRPDVNAQNAWRENGGIAFLCPLLTSKKPETVSAALAWLVASVHNST
jgi:hypothetical protein